MYVDFQLHSLQVPAAEHSCIAKLCETTSNVVVLLFSPPKLSGWFFLGADQRRLGQILKDAYNGIVQQTQTEQLAHAIAQQNIKVHGKMCPLSIISLQHAWLHARVLIL